MKFTFGCRVRVNKPGNFYDGCYAEVEDFYPTKSNKTAYRIKVESPYCSANVKWAEILEEDLVYVSCGPSRFTKEECTSDDEWKEGIEASREI